MKTKLIELLKRLRTSETIWAWNEYSLENKSTSTIYLIEELDEILTNKTPTEIGELIYNGDFSIKDDYFIFENNNLLESFNKSNVKQCIDYEKLADYILKSKNDFYIHEIENFLKEIHK